MTPAALRAFARVLGALLAWRHHGRRRPTPSHHARLDVHGAPLLGRRRRRAHVATNGSATDARPAGAGLGLYPQRHFSGQAVTRDGARQVLSRLASLRATRRAWP